MVEDNNEFDDMIDNMVEPLSLASVIEGLRIITEATLYIEDYISDSFNAVQDFATSMLEHQESKAAEPVEDGALPELEVSVFDLDMPSLRAESTIYLTTLVEAAKQFCESVTEFDEDEEDEDDD